MFDLLVLESTGGPFWIADVKGVYSRARYIPGRRDKKPRHAVNLRASQVNGDYTRKATAADQIHNSTPDGVAGPIAKELASYPPVRGLAFGSFFEASDSVDELVASAAKAEADYEWKNLGGASFEAAYSAFFARNRRRLGIIGAASTFAPLILNGSRYTAHGTSITSSPQPPTGSSPSGRRGRKALLALWTSRLCPFPSRSGMGLGARRAGLTGY